MEFLGYMVTYHLTLSYIFAVSRNDCTISHSHQQSMRVSVFPHLLQYLLCLTFHLAILGGIQRNLMVTLILISYWLMVLSIFLWTFYPYIGTVYCIPIYCLFKILHICTGLSYWVVRIILDTSYLPNTHIAKTAICSVLSIFLMVSFENRNVFIFLEFILLNFVVPFLLFVF